MKKLRVTYHMSRPGETAETCVTLTVTDEAAAELMTFEPWELVFRANRTAEDLSVALHRLSRLQGYTLDEILTVEEAKENE